MRHFCLLIGLGAFSQAAAQASLTDPSVSKTVLMEGMRDIPAQRTMYSRTLENDSGKILMHFSKSPLNYRNASGEWEPIRIEPVSNGNGWEVATQNYPISVDAGGKISVTMESGNAFTLRTTDLFGMPVTPGNPVLNGTEITWNSPQDFHLVAGFRNNGLKLDYKVNNAVPAGNYTIHQELQLPEGYSLHTSYTPEHSLEITDASGKVQGMLYPIVCWDANQSYSTGEYKFKKITGGYKITLELDAGWFGDPARAYPITVDPLVTGPTSLWSGGYMPSCLLPAYNVDSMLVTIPGGVTITGVFITANYYATPFSTAIMSDGEMFFSTSCDSSQTLTVAPPNGNLPGTAYLDDVDFRNPLACCFGGACNDRNVYVRMHLARSVGGSGCNLSYIYYDPTTQWPFSVYIEGRTVETAGIGWSVTPTTMCSDECELNIHNTVRFGVPPYTSTHPWALNPLVFGNTNPTCVNLQQSGDLDIIRPNCPLFCDPTTQLQIQPPVIVDACGNQATGLQPKTINLKPTPQITINPDSIQICSGESAHVDYTACPPGTTVQWTTTNGFSGQNTMDSTYFNTTDSLVSTVYQATASLNGCVADTQYNAVWVSPNPTAGIDHDTLAFINDTVTFTDLTNYYTGTAQTWEWTFGDGGNAPTSPAVHDYDVPGTYQVCLIVTTVLGCKDTICDSIKIIPTEVNVPNVMTPNGDGTNDLLYFQYLEYFGASVLKVYNRWGIIVYESNHYMNDWAGDNVVDGTYWYILTLENGKEHTSTLNIFH